jgi:hypothetical protein
MLSILCVSYIAAANADNVAARDRGLIRKLHRGCARYPLKWLTCWMDGLFLQSV